VGRLWNFLNFEIQIETFGLVAKKCFAIIEFCITLKVYFSEIRMELDKFSIGYSNFLLQLQYLNKPDSLKFIYFCNFSDFSITYFGSTIDLLGKLIDHLACYELLVFELENENHDSQIFQHNNLNSYPYCSFGVLATNYQCSGFNFINL
jgi:hypothetical protein